MKRAAHFSQIILYAKKLFKRDIIIEDLRVLIGDAYLLEIEHVSDESIRSVLIDILWEMGVLEDRHKFNEFMERISPEKYYRFVEGSTISDMDVPHPDYDFTNAVIETAIGMLSTLKMTNADGTKLILLNKPNFKLLPPRKESTIKSVRRFEWSTQS